MYTSIYNPARQYNFIQRQAILLKNRWLIAAAAIFGVMLVISLISAYFNPNKVNGLLDLYFFVFMASGLIFTSQAFSELHHPNQAFTFLTLPVSTLEKLVGSWLLTSPVYILVYTLVTFVIYLISCMVAGFTVSPLNYFSGEYWELIGSYMVIQTIFLWGACYFRKNNFLKTVLILLVFFIALGMYSGIFALVLFGGSIGENVNINTGPELEQVMEGYFAPLMEFLFSVVLAPYMLLVSYFTLKERQL